MKRLISQASHWLSVAALFTRFAALSFSIVLPLVGAATVRPVLDIRHVLALVVVALAFHVYAYVVNDVVDLELDRTQPLRQRYPLVQGQIGRWIALAVAILQLPIAFLVTFWLQPDASAYVAFGGAVCLLTVYDLWGKRTAFPPAMDALQALGWSMLVVYGALAAPAMPNGLTVVASSFVFVFVIQINSIHGGLRDLANDLAHGIQTTPALLGVKAAPFGVIVSRRFLVYAVTLQVAQAALVFLPLVTNTSRYERADALVVAGVVALFVLTGNACLLIAARSAHAPQRMIASATWHIVLLFGALLAVLLPRLAPDFATTLGVVYLVPLLWTFSPWRRAESGSAT